MNPERDEFRLGANRGLPPNAGGPGALLARVVGAVAAVGFLVLTLFLGAFVFAGVLVAAAVGAVALRIWLWWQMRHGPGRGADPLSGRFGLGGHMRGSQGSQASQGGTGPRGASGGSPRQGTVVDAEYEVVSGEERRGASAQDEDTDSTGR